MENITKTPYAGWLEMVLREIMERKPVKMGVVMLLEDGEAVSGYYGEVSPMDITMMANHMNLDAMWRIVCANADEILRIGMEMAEKDEEEGSDED